MKTSIKKGRHIQAIVLIALLVAVSSFTIILEVQKLVVESNHSTVQFSVPISNGITRITGKFTDYTIDIDYVDKDFTKSTISTTIKVESINTGIAGRDDHLRTKDFFDVETYPHITFTSDRIEKQGEGYVAYGDFTMHGITKKIEFPFTVTGVDGENTIGIQSRLTINRMEYGVGSDFQHSSMDNFLGEDIGVEIDFWTKKKKEKKKE